MRGILLAGRGSAATIYNADMAAPETVYLDTSVFGDAFEASTMRPTRELIDEILAGRYRACTSVLVADELSPAPPQVRTLFAALRPSLVWLEPTAQALALQRSYLAQGILTMKWADDALHIAYATLAQCDYVTSWNLRHIVNGQKIPLFNAVNLLHGYNQLDIRTPWGLIRDEE
jgi:hypothetical protein